MIEPGTVMALSEVVKNISSIFKQYKENKEDKNSAKLEAQFNDQLIDIQTKVMSIQTEYFKVLEENRRMKQDLDNELKWAYERQRYKLHFLPMNENLMFYAIKQSYAHEEPPHRLCPNCFERKVKSHLLNHLNGGLIELKCNVCNASISTGFRGLPAPNYAPD